MRTALQSRPPIPPQSAFAGFRFPPDVIVLAVRWYLRFGRPTATSGSCSLSGALEVVTDRALAYPAVLEELLPAAWHRTERYANNHIEADHGR